MQIFTHMSHSKFFLNVGNYAGDVKGYAEASKKIRHPYEDKNDLKQDTGSKLYQSLGTTLGLQEKARDCQPEVTFISPHGGSSKWPRV